MPRLNITLPNDRDDITQQSNNNPLEAIIGLLNGNLDSDNFKPGSLDGGAISPGSITVESLSDSLRYIFLPIGSVLDWHSDGLAIPEGFQLADGAVITDARSPRVGKVTVNAINKFRRGVTNQDLITTPVVGGTDNVTLTEAQLPSHSHTITDPKHSHGTNDTGHGHTVNDPGHYHGRGIATGLAAAGSERSAGSNNIDSSFTSKVGTGVTVQGATTGVSIKINSTGITINSSGSGASHTNVPAYVGLVPIEKIF